MSKFRAGDRVDWQYTHANGRRSRFERVKTGTFIRTIRPHKWVRSISNMPVWCMVHFDGNKNPSRVMLRELRPAA